MGNVFDTTAKLPPLNKRRSRGKWYVSLRGTPLTLVKGFEGSACDLADYLDANKQQFIELVRSFDVRLLGDPDRWRKTAAILLLKSAQARSQRRSIPFDLTEEWVADRLSRIGDSCEISGLGFVYAASEKIWHRNPRGPSLDRIVPSDGYVTTNVRIVCTGVNVAINEWGERHFYEMCEAVLNHKSVVQNGR